MDQIYTSLIQMFPKINTYLMAGALVFARMLGFFRFCPIFNRKDIPALVKIPMALIVTIFIVPFLSPEKVLTQCDSFALSIVLNVVVGAMIGYMAQLITIAIDCGAEMINMQMGLSSATALDPTTSAQVSILTKMI
jgi:flagellar biosynthetic protein FliR